MAARQSYIASPSVTAFRIVPSLLHKGNKIAICQSVLQQDRCGRMLRPHRYACRALLHAFA
jgi:hypothetical protein